MKAKVTVAKNKRTGFLLRVRKKIATLKAICDDREVLKLDKLSTSSDRMKEAWRTYESSQLDVLGLLAEYEVEDEQVTFTKMKESYEAVKAEVNEHCQSGEQEEADQEGSYPRTPQDLRPLRSPFPDHELIQKLTEGICHGGGRRD